MTFQVELEVFVGCTNIEFMVEIIHMVVDTHDTVFIQNRTEKCFLSGSKMRHIFCHLN